MTGVVLDASAAVLVLAGRGEQHEALRARVGRFECHAPDLIDAEVGNVLRRHCREGAVSDAVAVAALTALSVLIDFRYQQTGPLATAAWRLRHAVSFYDGLYVALANALGVHLVTADARLSRASGVTCAVELVG